MRPSLKERNARARIRAKEFERARSLLDIAAINVDGALRRVGFYTFNAEDRSKTNTDPGRTAWKIEIDRHNMAWERETGNIRLMIIPPPARYISLEQQRAVLLAAQTVLRGEGFRTRVNDDFYGDTGTLIGRYLSLTAKGIGRDPRSEPYPRRRM